MASDGKQASWIARTHADVARFCGVSLQSVNGWARLGMPGATGAYDLSEIVQWLRSAGPWRQHAKSEDPLLDPIVDSPGLERYRLAKAALAELELEEKTGKLLSREKAKGIFGRWATIIRRLGERLGKRYGPDAAVQVNQALEECARVIVYELGGNGSADNGTVRGVDMVPESGDGPGSEADQ